jgi:host factor-I protein
LYLLQISLGGAQINESIGLHTLSDEQTVQRCIYNGNMSPSMSKRHISKAPPPDETGHEALYLRSLCDRQVNVQIKMRDGETVRGWIEYFDDGMLRLTREGKPNLFIYKHQISTITEVGKLAPRRAKAATQDAKGSAKNGGAS